MLSHRILYVITIQHVTCSCFERKILSGNSIQGVSTIADKIQISLPIFFYNSCQVKACISKYNSLRILSTPVWSLGSYLLLAPAVLSRCLAPRGSKHIRSRVSNRSCHQEGPRLAASMDGLAIPATAGLALRATPIIPDEWATTGAATADGGTSHI